MSADPALVVGRYQPFHRGHDALLDYARERHDDLYIGVGTDAPWRTADTPLTYAETRRQLDAAAPDATVFRVPDQDDDVSWVDEVEEQAPVDDFVPVTGNGHVALCFDAAGYDVDFLGPDDLERREEYRGTAIRETVRNGGAWRHLVPDAAEQELDHVGFEYILRNDAPTPD